MLWDKVDLLHVSSRKVYNSNTEYNAKLSVFNFASFSIKMHEERKTKQKTDDKVPEGAVPAYLLDREGQNRAKVLSNMIKQKRKEKAVSNLLLEIKWLLVE